MPDEFELEFGSREAANELRDDLGDFLAGEPDQRTKTVEISAEAPEPVLEQATGQAALTREERSTGMPGLDLTPGEKRSIDFSEISPVEARHMKAEAAEKGVGDFRAAMDSTLTVGESEEIFERAARETSGGRDARESIQSRQAEAFKQSESEIMEHARKGVKAGSKQAEQELRRRGVSESEIARLKRQPAGRIDERTKVLFPDVGEISPGEWSTAKRSHEHRRVQAQNSDEGKSAQRVVADVDTWRNNKQSFDFPGVDTPVGVSNWLDDDRAAEFESVTDELWPWQR